MTIKCVCPVCFHPTASISIHDSVMTWWDEAIEGVGPKPWASYNRWDGASGYSRAIALGPIGQHELHSGHPKIV
jgi:hypothetical protein